MQNQVNTLVTKKGVLTINEVDCYIGNAHNTKYRTHSATQHQLLLNDTPIGFRNGVADAGRGERIVLSKEVNEKFVKLFNEAVNLSKTLKSEYCNSIEEYYSASAYNKPIKAKMQELIAKMHKIESLDLDLPQFSNSINFA